MSRPLVNKWASSIAVQKWDYQQKLIDMMGDPAEVGLGQLATAQPVAQVQIDVINVAKDCGLAVATAGFVGYVAGRVGVLPTAVGVGISTVIIRLIAASRKS